MTPDGRFVWMTHADVSWLHTSADTPQRAEALIRLNVGFNSAPADPTEVMAQAMGDPHTMSVLLGDYADGWRRASDRGLRALGMPNG